MIRARSKFFIARLRKKIDEGFDPPLIYTQPVCWLYDSQSGAIAGAGRHQASVTTDVGVIAQWKSP